MLVLGCATVTPQYTVRPAPIPEESAWATELERTISVYQARELERNGARRILPGERLFGFDAHEIVTKLSRTTERPYLDYRVFLIFDKEPNAAALADGRIYITQSMLEYLASRGSHPSELGFVLGHELAHTAAQHLVKRYRQLQQQQMVMAIVGLGTAAVTRGRGPQAEQAARIAQNVTSVINEVVTSGYSQEQELEADQLGIRYVMRAGYDPRAALAMLEDFKRYDRPGSFLRSHPYTQRRKQDLERYLSEVTGAETAPTPAPAAPPSVPPAHWQPAGPFGAPAIAGPLPPAPGSIEERRRRLLDAQKLYPAGSQSWRNLQRQLDELR